MREIKFRVWNIVEKGMFNPLAEGTRSFGLHVYLSRPDNFTVMQYTGHIDYNRREIFEADKVTFFDKYKGHITGTVEWSPLASQWWVVWNDGTSRYKPLEPDYGDEQTQCQWCEVIGNIYETPSTLTHEPNEPSKERKEAVEESVIECEACNWSKKNRENAIKMIGPLAYNVPGKCKKHSNEIFKNK